MAGAASFRESLIFSFSICAFPLKGLKTVRAESKLIRKL